MSTGDFVAFSAAFGAFFVALVTLSETVLGLLNLVPIYARAKPILEGLPEVDASKRHPGELQGAIDVVRLGFSYTADQEILRNTTFSVRPGGIHRAGRGVGLGKVDAVSTSAGFREAEPRLDLLR